MPSFNDTVDLERAFLRAITSSVMMARTYMNQGREEYFTSIQRQTIFALAEKALKETNTLLTKPVYEYEIGSKVDDSQMPSFIGEWNMIEGVESFDAPEAIIAKLRSAETGRKVLKTSENIVELLTQGNIDDAVSFLKREAMMLGGVKNDRPVVELSNYEARLALIRDKQQNPQKYQGLKTGFPTLDEQTGGLFPGELTLIAGITGLGKSTICRSIARGITTLNGAKNVLHIANEEYLEQVQYKYDAVFMGIPYQDFKFAKITDLEIERWKKYMQEDMRAAGRGQVFIKEVPAFTDVSLIEQQYRILENQGIPIHAIIIDHLPHVIPIQKAWGENDERAKAATDCKELARSLRLPVITPTQAATDVEKKQMAGKRAGKMDVYGSKGQIHVANTFLILTYKGTDDTQTTIPDYQRDVFWLVDAKKNRDGAPFNFNAKHLVKTGVVVECTDPSLKPTAKADAAAADVLKEANTTPTTAPGGVKPPDPVSTPSIPLVVNTGLRDASMKDMEAIEREGDEDEEVLEAPKTTSVEDQLMAQALNEVKTVPETVPVVKIEEKIEVEKPENIGKPAIQTKLDRLRKAGIKFGGV